MENPHAAQQAALVGRIANSVDRLNTVVEAINQQLGAILSNPSTTETDFVSDVWTGYAQSVALCFQSIPPRHVIVDSAQRQREQQVLEQQQAAVQAARAAAAGAASAAAGSVNTPAKRAPG